MKIRLRKRWGSFLPGQEVSVAPERARYLVDTLGVARYLPGQEPKPEPEPPKKEPPKEPETGAEAGSEGQNSEEATPEGPPDYAALKKPELQALAQDRGIDPSQKKEELVEALLAWDAEHPETSENED